MPRLIPPHLEAALLQLGEALAKVEGHPVDLLKVPWPEIEKGIIKILMGAFDLRRPEHAFADLEALTHLAHHGPFRVLMAGLLHQGFVLVRVERLAEGGDRFDAVLGERREDLLVDDRQPLGHAGGRRGARATLRSEFVRRRRGGLLAK